jgi:hypothetical protein
MRFIFLCLLIFLLIKTYSQTGIGTTSPDPSAKLDITSTNKGFLPPRVTLTSTTDVSTIATPATGLLIYNTGNNVGLAAGYYYWNGAVWTTIATAGGSGIVAAEFGTQVLASNVAISSNTPTDVLSFTLPSAGTWVVISFLRAQGSPGFAGEFGIYDPTGTLVPNSEILAAYGQNASTGTGIITITISGAGVYKIKAWASTGSYSVLTDFNGRSGVTWNKISGNVPMTVINYGDVKTGFQSADHNGWVKLDGRLKSSLSSTQQAKATSLGIGTNLPDATNAFLVQNAGTIGSVTGSNAKTITQANLPNINFPTATTSTNGDHTHWISGAATDDRNFTGTGANGQNYGIVADAGSYTSYDPNYNYGRYTLNAGNHSHTVTVSSGGSGTALDVTPKSLSVNTFIYLGY